MSSNETPSSSFEISDEPFAVEHQGKRVEVAHGEKVDILNDRGEVENVTIHQVTGGLVSYERSDGELEMGVKNEEFTNVVKRRIDQESLNVPHKKDISVNGGALLEEDHVFQVGHTYRFYVSGEEEEITVKGVKILPKYTIVSVDRSFPGAGKLSTEILLNDINQFARAASIVEKSNSSSKEGPQEKQEPELGTREGVSSSQTEEVITSESSVSNPGNSSTQKGPQTLAEQLVELKQETEFRQEERLPSVDVTHDGGVYELSVGDSLGVFHEGKSVDVKVVGIIVDPDDQNDPICELQGISWRPKVSELVEAVIEQDERDEEAMRSGETFDSHDSLKKGEKFLLYNADKSVVNVVVEGFVQHPRTSEFYVLYKDDNGQEFSMNVGDFEKSSGNVSDGGEKVSVDDVREAEQGAAGSVAEAVASRGSEHSAEGTGEATQHVEDGPTKEDRDGTSEESSGKKVPDSDLGNNAPEDESPVVELVADAKGEELRLGDQVFYVGGVYAQKDYPEIKVKIQGKGGKKSGKISYLYIKDGVEHEDSMSLAKFADLYAGEIGQESESQQEQESESGSTKESEQKKQEKKEQQEQGGSNDQTESAKEDPPKENQSRQDQPKENQQNDQGESDEASDGIIDSSDKSPGDTTSMSHENSPTNGGQKNPEHAGFKSSTADIIGAQILPEELNNAVAEYAAAGGFQEGQASLDDLATKYETWEDAKQSVGNDQKEFIYNGQVYARRGSSSDFHLTDRTPGLMGGFERELPADRKASEPALESNKDADASTETEGSQKRRFVEISAIEGDPSKFVGRVVIEKDGVDKRIWGIVGSNDTEFDLEFIALERDVDKRTVLHGDLARKYLMAEVDAADPDLVSEPEKEPDSEGSDENPYGSEGFVKELQDLDDTTEEGKKFPAGHPAREILDSVAVINAMEFESNRLKSNIAEKKLELATAEGDHVQVLTTEIGDLEKALRENEKKIDELRTKNKELYKDVIARRELVDGNEASQEEALKENELHEKFENGTITPTEMDELKEMSPLFVLKMSRAKLAEKSAAVEKSKGIKRILDVKGQAGIEFTQLEDEYKHYVDEHQAALEAYTMGKVNRAENEGDLSQEMLTQINKERANEFLALSAAKNDHINGGRSWYQKIGDKIGSSKWGGRLGGFAGGFAAAQAAGWLVPGAGFVGSGLFAGVSQYRGARKEQEVGLQGEVADLVKEKSDVQVHTKEQLLQFIGNTRDEFREISQEIERSRTEGKKGMAASAAKWGLFAAALGYGAGHAVSFFMDGNPGSSGVVESGDDGSVVNQDEGQLIADHPSRDVLADAGESTVDIAGNVIPDYSLGENDAGHASFGTPETPSVEIDGREQVEIDAGAGLGVVDLSTPTEPSVSAAETLDPSEVVEKSFLETYTTHGSVDTVSELMWEAVAEATGRDPSIVTGEIYKNEILPILNVEISNLAQVNADVATKVADLKPDEYYKVLGNIQEGFSITPQIDVYADGHYEVTGISFGGAFSELPSAPETDVQSFDTHEQEQASATMDEIFAGPEPEGSQEVSTPTENQASQESVVQVGNVETPPLAELRGVALREYISQATQDLQMPGNEQALKDWGDITKYNLQEIFRTTDSTSLAMYSSVDPDDFGGRYPDREIVVDANINQFRELLNENLPQSVVDHLRNSSTSIQSFVGRGLAVLHAEGFSLEAGRMMDQVQAAKDFFEVEPGTAQKEQI